MTINANLMRRPISAHSCAVTSMSPAQSMTSIRCRVLPIGLQNHDKSRKNGELIMNEIAKHEAPQLNISLIKRTVAPNATDDQLAMFIHDCNRRGVHPLDK